MFSKQEGIHLMAHQPLGGRPVAAVNPNADQPGPLSDPEVRLCLHLYIDLFIDQIDAFSDRSNRSSTRDITRSSPAFLGSSARNLSRPKDGP